MEKYTEFNITVKMKDYYKQHEHAWVKKKLLKVSTITEIARCNGC